MIHLDSCFLIDLHRERRRDETGPASRRMADLVDEELAISLFVACELYAGAERSHHPQRERGMVEQMAANLTVVVPDDSFPLAYAALFGQTSRRGVRLSTMDLLIATAAKAAGAPLLTRNVKDFSRIPDLELITY